MCSYNIYNNDDLRKYLKKNRNSDKLRDLKDFLHFNIYCETHTEIADAASQPIAQPASIARLTAEGAAAPASAPVSATEEGDVAAIGLTANHATKAEEPEAENTISQERIKLQSVYADKEAALNNYFKGKSLVRSISASVQINQDVKSKRLGFSVSNSGNQADNSTSLGFSVSNSGIIANFQPHKNGVVEAAGLKIGDLILDYTLNHTNKVYTFINGADMAKKTDGKEITISYVKGNETNPLTESTELTTLINARRNASIELDELIILEDNYTSAEKGLQEYMRTNIIQSSTTSITNKNTDFGFATEDNGKILSLQPNGSMKSANLNEGDIILTYKCQDDAKENIYTSMKDFVDTAKTFPITITFISKKNLKQGKKTNLLDELKSRNLARIKAKIALDAYLKKLKTSPPAKAVVEDKKDGEDGKNGADGEDGEDGKNGKNGEGLPRKARGKNPKAQANNDDKNTSIENAIGAIVLALALTISESNPKSYAKKEIDANMEAITQPKNKPGANTKKKLNESEIAKFNITVEEKATLRSDYEKLFEAIKKESNKKTKKKSLIDTLNKLLSNKRVIEELTNKSPEEADNTQSTKNSDMTGGEGQEYEFFPNQTKEIENHMQTINKIMTYLFEEKISMRYQWVEIKKSANKGKIVYEGKVAIISKLNKDNANDTANKGKWAFNVWIPDKGGLPVLVRPNKNELKTKLQVKDGAGNIIDRFHTENISIYDVEFLGETYDPKNEMNFQPIISGQNLGSIKQKQKGILRRGLNRGLNAVTSISPVTGTYTNAERAINYVSARGLREDLKELIKDVIESKFTNEVDIELLKTIINFYNKKRSIKDILISKISYIFASGETRLNLFNKKNLAKNFKAEDQEGGAEEGSAEEGGGKEGGAEEGGTEEGGTEDLEGGGGYGFRNFDKKDAENIIRLILDNLKELEKASNSSRDLLFSTYLKKFLKITPSELNKILQDFTRVSKLSINVIRHYAKRLNSNQEATEGDIEDPAAVISNLNFALKNNVQSFIGSIVYITLHTEQMVGSKAKIQYYLDNEYNKAMKLPTGEEQTLIDNFQLKQSLDYIFGPENNSIKNYRNKLKTIDSYIDSMNEKNIETKLQEFHKVFAHVTIEDDKIKYTIPGNIRVNIRENIEKKKDALETEAIYKKKLADAETLVKELLEKYPSSSAEPGTATSAESTAETAKHVELRRNLQKLSDTLGPPPPSSK